MDGTFLIGSRLRPVCYQDLPDELLPAMLTDAAARGVPRYVS